MEASSGSKNGTDHHKDHDKNTSRSEIHEEVEEDDSSSQSDDAPSPRRLRPTLSHTSSTNAVGGVIGTPLEPSWTGRSSATGPDPAYEIDFAVDEKDDPQNWSVAYKITCVAIFSFATTVIVLYSSCYTSSIPGMETSFSVSESEGIGGVTTYLMGIAVGSVILAPLSEMYGRRPIYLAAGGLFVVFVLPGALAQNIATVLAARFFAAFAGAALISNAPGSVNDMVSEQYRALAFSFWSLGPMNGPTIGPLLGGFVYQYAGWRWTNWLVVILGAVAWGMMALIPETYGPAILRRRAHRKRQSTGDGRWWSRYDERQKIGPLLQVNLSRPFVLALTEPICIFWDIYIALVYAILYLCFVAYPIVFGDLRGWSPGFIGLSYCGIGVGGILVIVGEPLIRKAIAAHRIDPTTGAVPPEAMVSVVCVAALLIPTGQILFAWTSTPNFHWIAPLLAGVPFGAGNTAVFIYGSSYLMHSYGIYAASALAGNAVLRSTAGATLPLAGPAMYRNLGPHWAGTTLGLLEVLCIPIPFAFYRYGHLIRERSALITQMRADQEKQQRRRNRAEEKVAGNGQAGGGTDLEKGSSGVSERSSTRI